eukprot:scaffold118873_cov60-Phaeocystis_antarctica.AAC.1
MCPAESQRGHIVRCGLRAGRREAAGDRDARSVAGRARLQIGSRARGGAHVEHLAHVRGAGGVEAQRLVECRRALPSRKEGMRCVARCEPGGGEAAGDRGARSARSVQGRARLQIGGRPRGGAHEEHAVHARDAGGVEAPRPVERLRGLPRVERRACGARRGIPVERREAAGDRGARNVQERARLQVWGRAWGGAHPEHVLQVRDPRRTARRPHSIAPRVPYATSSLAKSESFLCTLHLLQA